MRPDTDTYTEYHMSFPAALVAFVALIYGLVRRREAQSSSERYKVAIRRAIRIEKDKDTGKTAHDVFRAIAGADMELSR